MDKREALEIYLKVHDECIGSNCIDCVFRESYNGREVCVLFSPCKISLAESVRAKLKDMKGKQEESYVPLENVGSIIANGPSTIKEPVPTPKYEAKNDNKEINMALTEEKCKNGQQSFASGDNLSPVESRLSDKIDIDRCGLFDSVKHPYHYLRGGMECIDVIKAAVRYLKPFEAYCVGNIIKYVWRYSEKNGSEDLRKAKQYLEWLIEEVEEREQQ